MTEDPRTKIPGNSSYVQGYRDLFGRAMDLCAGRGTAAGSSLSERSAVACLISLGVVLWEDGPPNNSGRLLPSTLTRLADGLGPKRLPYAFHGDTPPKTRVPRSCMLQDSAIRREIFILAR